MSTQSELLVCADWHKFEAKKLRELATMHEDQCDCIRMMADSLSMQCLNCGGDITETKACAKCFAPSEDESEG